MFEIRLFGPPEIRVDGINAQPDTRKALAVVARLALSRGPTSRDTLAALFWPDSDESRARSALRRTLSTLRSIVGDALETDRRQARLVLDRAWVDVIEMEASLASTKDHGHDASEVCERCLPPLESAVDLYRGDFLDGFTLGRAPDFEEWVLGTAAHYRHQATLALERLATGRAAGGDYPGAIAAAGRWLEIDPIHEPAYRQLMLLHAWAGDRGGAIDAYREGVRVLDVELGVTPLEETTELYGAILDEDLPRPPAARRRIEVRVTPPPPSAPPPPLLVGRDRQWEVLTAELAAASDGGRLVAVTGEAGVGKTRLLEELATGGSAEVWSLARAYRGEQAIPYGVVAQLVEGLLDSPATATIGSLPDWVLATTARLVPSVLALRHNVAVDAAVDDLTAERRFIDGLEHFLAAGGRREPGVLLVDDAQWLDHASATFLAYLVRRLSNHRLLLVVSFRDGELPGDSPLDPALRDAETKGRLTSVELGPLSMDDVTHLVEAMGSDLDPVELWRRTGGIPLFVIEHLEAATPAEVIPDRVRRALTDRLGGLSELARQVLTAAAVLDGMIDPTALQRVSGRGEDETIEALDELLQGRLLREAGEGAAIEFVHPPMREASYETASLLRRRLLHRRAAEVLSAAPKHDARTAAAAARHLHLAGDLVGAATVSASAGDLAREVFAHAEAAEHYRNAIALGHPDPGRLHLALGDVALAIGAYGEALSEYQAAGARTGGAETSLADHRLGETHRRVGHWEAAEEHFRRAEEHHPEPESLYADWSLLEHRRGDHEAAMRLAERARSVAEERQDDRGMARALDILGVVTIDPTQAVAHLEKSLTLAGDDPALRTAALNNLGLVVEEAGDLERARRHAEEALELAQRSGDRHRQAALHNRLADLHHAAGDHQASERELTQAVRLFAEVGSEPGTWEPEVWLLTQW